MDALERTGLTPADFELLPGGPAAPSSTSASCAGARSTSPPTFRPGASPTCRSSSRAASASRSGTPNARWPAGWSGATRARSPPAPRAALRRPDGSTTRSCARSPRGSGATPRRHPREGNVFNLMRRIGQAKAVLAADYTAQLSHNVGKVVFFAKHIDVMDAAEDTFARRGIGYSSIRGDQTPQVRQANIDAFVNDADVAVVGLLADRGRRRAQPAGRLERRARRAVLDGRRADPGHRPRAPHRPGPAGHRLAHPRRPDHRHPHRRAHRQQGGLAARALDGSDEEIATSVDVQLEALVALLTDALTQRA